MADLLTVKVDVQGLDEVKEIIRDALDRAEKAEAKLHKYRWHDLRKDPDDLPKDSDSTVFYECVIENHIYDPYYPSFQYSDCQKSFGCWFDFFYPVALGFVDSEFKTIDDMGYEIVIAWREIEPFEEDE